MPVNIRRVAFIAVVLQFSCKTVREPLSALRHIWGETSRGEPVIDCVQESVGAPEYKNYIAQHVLHLAKANPKTFTEPLLGERFCIVTLDDPEVDAGASGDGTLFFNTGILKVAQTDAQFAAAVAHELAHISLSHGSMTFDLFVKIRSDFAEQNQALISAAEALQNERELYDSMLESFSADEHSKLMNDLLAMQAQLFKKQAQKLSYAAASVFDACQALDKAIQAQGADAAMSQARQIFTANLNIEALKEFQAIEGVHCQLASKTLQQDTRKRLQVAQWVEIEADEVGYEFFLRAGYPAQEFAQFFRNVEKHYRSSTEVPSVCIRGEQNHPKDCWRAKHADFEKSKHRLDIEQLGAQSPEPKFPEGQLNKLKDRHP